MAFREVTLLELREVLRLWLRGRSTRATARSTGVTRNTVRSYLEAARACGLSPEQGEQGLTEDKAAEVMRLVRSRPKRAKGEAWARCEESREFLEQKLGQGLRLSKVWRLLGREGVEVPYPTLHRFAVSELGFGRGTTTIPVEDGAPGQELQVDTGWMGYLEPGPDGRRRRFRAWIFTAVHSRHRFVYACLAESTASAIEACEAAWEFFGGVFHVLIPDNTKAIVEGYDPLAPRVTAAFLEYAQARGFEVDPTRRRSPQDKGRVERAVIPTRDDCFAGEVLGDLDAARRRARDWCLREYGMRRHSRTLRLPLEHFETAERPVLLPPPSAPYDVPSWASPKVARDQHVQVGRALYSLPRDHEGRRLVGLELRARSDRSTVRLYLDHVLIKAHPRQPPGGRSTDPADFPSEKAAYARRDVDFLAGQAEQHGAAVGRLARRLLEGPLPWTRMRRVYALLGLCKRFGDARVEQASAAALEADLVDVRRLERMLALGERSAAPAAASLAPVIPLHRYLRPARTYRLRPTIPTGSDQEEVGNGVGAAPRRHDRHHLEPSLHRSGH